MRTDPSLDRRGDLLRRLTPLAGVLYAGLSVGGDLVIGPFPEGATSGASLRDYYAAHGAQVAAGGALLVWSAVCLGVFAVALWARVRDAVPPVVAGLVLLGAAVATAAELGSASLYSFLGEHGADGHIAPAALQAWQLAATEIGSSGGLVLLALGLTVAAFGHRALPRWIAASGVLIVAAEFTPLFFLASIVFLVWAAVTGVALAVRPSPRPVPAAAALAVG